MRTRRNDGRARFATALLLGSFACGGQNAQVAPTTGPSSAQAPASPAWAEPPLPEGNASVVSLPIEGTDAVAISILFYTGSVDDPADRKGLTALSASLVAEGGTATKSYAELLRALYPMATEIGVAVDKEQTVFSAVVHTEQAERFIPILAEVLLKPRLGEADFQRIKDRQKNDLEKRLKATDDENLGKELLNRMMYPGDHPYGHPVQGTSGGLAAITLEDVKRHVAEVFGKKRMVVGLAGKVTPELESALTSALSGLPEGRPRLVQIRRATLPTETRVLIAEKPSAQAVAVSVGYPHFSRRGHPDFAALVLLQSYFGEHRQFHGILMDQIREKRGLNYGDYAYVESFVQEGYSRMPRTNIGRRHQHFEMWLRPVAYADAIFALRLSMYFLDRLVREGLKDEDVKRTATFLGGYTRLSEITPRRRLGHALDDHFYSTSGYLDSLRAELGRLDAETVNGAMRRHLVPAPVHVAMVAPNAQALRAALLSGEASAKTYAAKVSDEVLATDRNVVAFPLGLTEANVEIVSVDSLFVD